MVLSLFSFTSWPFVCFLWKNVCSVSLPTFKWDCLYFCYWFVWRITFQYAVRPKLTPHLIIIMGINWPRPGSLFTYSRQVSSCLSQGTNCPCLCLWAPSRPFLYFLSALLSFFPFIKTPETKPHKCGKCAPSPTYKSNLHISVCIFFLKWSLHWGSDEHWALKVYIKDDSNEPEIWSIRLPTPKYHFVTRADMKGLMSCYRVCLDWTHCFLQLWLGVGASVLCEGYNRVRVLTM